MESHHIQSLCLASGTRFEVRRVLLQRVSVVHPFFGWLTLHGMAVPQFVHSLSTRESFGLFPLPGSSE